MGSWGEGPFDSDAAGDMLDEVFKILMREIDKARPRQRRQKYISSYYQHARAAIEAGVRINPHGIDLQAAVIVLETILGDKEWIDGWKSPARIRRAVEKQLAEVKSVIRAKRLRVRLGPEQKKPKE